MTQESIGAAIEAIEHFSLAARAALKQPLLPSGRCTKNLTDWVWVHRSGRMLTQKRGNGTRTGVRPLVPVAPEKQHFRSAVFAVGILDFSAMAVTCEVAAIAEKIQDLVVSEVVPHSTKPGRQPHWCLSSLGDPCRVGESPTLEDAERVWQSD